MPVVPVMPVSTDRVPPHRDARAILERADLCTFNWNTRDGWPMGATVAFQWIDEQFWFSMDKSEARVRAIRRDPRASIVLRGPGTSLTVKGRCAFSDDSEMVEISDQHGNSITMDKNGIALKSAKDLVIEASGNVEIKGSKVDVK